MTTMYRTYDEAFIDDQFRLIQREGRNPIACGAYWNPGPYAIAVAIVFERQLDGEITHWKAYLGATVERGVANDRMTTEDATLHVAVHGLKLYEAEARGMLAEYADVLGPLAYWR